MGKRRRLKADLHIHTGEDLRDRPPYTAKDLVERAAAMGFEVLAVTNHDLFTFDSDLADWARARNVLLIPGIELSLAEGHVLVYNLKLDPKQIKTMADLHRLRRPDSLIVAAHPFFRWNSVGERLFEYAELFDALEFAHFYAHGFNPNHRTLEAARRLDLPLVGNSDAHLLHQLGRTYSLIEAWPTVEGVIEAVKSGRVEIKTKPLSWLTMAQILGQINLNRFRGHLRALAAR